MLLAMRRRMSNNGSQAQGTEQPAEALPTWTSLALRAAVVLSILASMVGVYSSCESFRPVKFQAEALEGPEASQPAHPVLKANSPELLDEKPVYSRYLTVYSRRYRLEGGREAEFDVVGHPSLEGFTFVVVCPVSLPRQAGGRPRFTLVQEFAAGSGSWHFAFPTGGVNRGEGLQAAAARELGEEAGLEASNGLFSLLPPEHTGILEIKWSRNRFQPFLALGVVQSDKHPVHRDVEETGLEVLEADEFQVMKLISSGDMFLPSAVTFQLAMQWLQAHGKA